MAALVLGGSVFVGHRLVETLVETGSDVAVLNRGQTPTVLPPGVERIVADRTDTAAMCEALAAREWDAVYDVSGFVMAAGGADIDGLLDLLDGRTGAYVYVSSIMAYRQGRGVFPWYEQDPVTHDPPTSYGGFKVAAERAVLEHHARRGFPGSVVRPAAIYGPGNNIYDMETPMFLRLRRGRPVIVPHGGLVVGSYGHVDDLCHAMAVMAGSRLADGEVVNVTAEAVTVAEYVGTLARIVGVHANLVLAPDEAFVGLVRMPFGHLFGRAHHAALSTRKAETLLGISPRYDLSAGHRHTYAWFMEHGLDRLEAPLSDPVWRASWDFDAEDEFLRRLGPATTSLMHSPEGDAR